MNKEAMKIMLPYMKKAFEASEESYTEALLENIRNLLECLCLQNAIMMTDEQFKDFEKEMDILR